VADMPVSIQIANAIATIAIAGVAVGLSLATWSDSHTTEQHQVTSKYASIKVDRPMLTDADKGKDGNWSETISGTGFNGDSLVYIYYPSAEDFEPQPSGGKGNQDYRECPFLGMPVLVNSGSFVAHVPIWGKLPGGLDYIYVQETTRKKNLFAPIQIGSKPQAAPTSTPTPTPSPSCKTS
jgi:predicted ribosomally synthesized peptide with SipW-like signal peptide